MQYKGLTEAFGGKLFNFLTLNFGCLVLFHPTPLRFREIVTMHSIMLGMGFVSQKKLACVNKSLIEAFGGKLFNFCYSISGI